MKQKLKEWMKDTAICLLVMSAIYGTIALSIAITIVSVQWAAHTKRIEARLDRLEKLR